MNTKQFARILEASDGCQVVLYIGLDLDSGHETLVALTPRIDGSLHEHTLAFEVAGLAEQLLAAAGLEQADVIRTVAVQHEMPATVQ